MSDKIVPAFEIDGHRVRRDGDMWCLTDLWRAAGGPKEKRPNDWLAGVFAREFREHVDAFLNAENPGIESVRVVSGGKDPAAWGRAQFRRAPIQLRLAARDS